MKIVLKLTMACFLTFAINNAMAFYLPKKNNSFSGYEAVVLADQSNLKVKSRKQATTMVKQRYNARVVSVVSTSANGFPGYRAKLLSKDGTVFYVFVNAKTGQMSRS